MTHAPTLSLEHRLAQIDAELPKAQQMADAERAYRAAYHVGGLWEGAGKHLEKLKAERTDLQLQAEGRRLAAAETRLRELDRELEEAQALRDKADQAVRAALENTTVQRYRQAPTVARNCGFAHSWVHFSAWYESGRERYQAMPEDGPYFVDNPACPAALKFNLDADRTAVRKWRQAVSDADVALLRWGNAADRRSRLLNENPELSTAG